MKNKQFSILNNGGGYNQRHLCKTHKRALAMVSAMTMLFTTSAVLPYSNFNIVGEITANAEEQHNYDSNGFCTDEACDNIYQPAEDTDGDGYYEIGNAGQLYWFAAQFNNEGKQLDAVLTTDIIVNEGVMSAETSGAREWTPIGNYNKQYKKTFDGQNHTISGLYYNSNSTVGSGFFGSVAFDGNIKNVGIINSYIKGKNYVGGVCGYLYTSQYYKASITNCYNTSTIIGTDSYTGGVCGNSSGGIISDCYNTGTVTGTSYVGGVCGYMSATYSKLTDSYNVGTVKSSVSSDFCGGIAGELRESSIKNCYSTNSTCGFVHTSATDDSEVKTAEQFASGEVAYLLNGDQKNIKWYQAIGTDSSPVLNGDKVVYYHNESCVSDTLVYTNKKSEHNLTSVEEKDSTCTDDGNVAYMYCEDCKKSFSDEDGKTEISNTVTNAKGHVLTHMARINATCTDEGNIEYWQCSECGKYFSDEACKTEVKLSDTVIKANGHSFTNYVSNNNTTCTEDGTKTAKCDNCDETETITDKGSAKGHKLTHTAEINATCTKDGNSAYWYCSECGKYFSDEACKTEIKLSDTVIKAKGHNLTIIKELKPTCTEDGHNDYVYCSDCETYFRGRYNLDPTLPEYQIREKTGHDFSGKYAYDKEKHWKTCNNKCGETVEENHTFVNGKCSACGLSEDYINALLSVDGDMNFNYSGNIGNWKENATIESDGYAWDAESKTLTLGDIYINGNLILPYDGGLNTIVIDDGAKPVVSGNITFSPYQTSLTVKGNGTLTAGFENGNVGSDNVLTITGGAEVITDFMMWSTNGGIEIKNNSRLNVSEYIFTEQIIMDDTAEFEIGCNVGIGSYENVENGFAGLERCIPSGYRMTRNFIIPKDAHLVYNEDKWSYEVQDKDGKPVTGSVTLKYNPRHIETKLAGHSISLDGNIGVNFYMELDDSIVNDKNAYMEFILPNGHTSKMYVKDAEKETIDGKTCYVFSCAVAPKEISESISAQIITSDGEGSFYEYSVEEYVRYISEHNGNYDKETIELVESMSLYAEYAANYFNYTAESLSEMDKVTEKDVADFEKKLTGTLPNGIEYYGSSLIIDSNTTIRHYFKIAKGTDVSKCGFSGQKNGYYYIEISDIPAGMLGTAYTTKIGNWSIEYSPMSYVYSVLASDSADTRLKSLCQTLYLYQQTAEAYQQTHNN